MPVDIRWPFVIIVSKWHPLGAKKLCLFTSVCVHNIWITAWYSMCCGEKSGSWNGRAKRGTLNKCVRFRCLPLPRPPSMESSSSCVRHITLSDRRRSRCRCRCCRRWNRRLNWGLYRSLSILYTPSPPQLRWLLKSQGAKPCFNLSKTVVSGQSCS